MQSENDNDESGKPDKYSRLGQQDLANPSRGSAERDKRD